VCCSGTLRPLSAHQLLITQHIYARKPAYCDTLQHTATFNATHCNALQHTTSHCNTHCNMHCNTNFNTSCETATHVANTLKTLQHKLQHTEIGHEGVITPTCRTDMVSEFLFKTTIAHCNTLQHNATQRNTL